MLVHTARNPQLEGSMGRFEQLFGTLRNWNVSIPAYGLCLFWLALMYCWGLYAALRDLEVFLFGLIGP